MELDLSPLYKHVPPEEVAAAGELLDGSALEALLLQRNEPKATIVIGGDVMLAGRAKNVIKGAGADYPFAATMPILRRASIVLVNLEGPLARFAEPQDRRFSYRVSPKTTQSLTRAGINAATLANNHLVDCGRKGVEETLEAVRVAGIARIGAGRDVHEAHLPQVFNVDGLRVGLLGYYWNRRCAATATHPGSAMDSPELLERDIRELRRVADRIVVTSHWGIPYEREPLDTDREKARLAIDCGADAVIGHHPHVIQPFEIYRQRPIFYSVGNYAFGSGNSRGEGLLVALRFAADATYVAAYPLYVKNRDPRVRYQPKVLCGAAASHCLKRLVKASGRDGQRLAIDEFRGTLSLPFAMNSIRQTLDET